MRLLQRRAKRKIRRRCGGGFTHQRGKGDSAPIQLPAAPWVKQPKIPGKITTAISVEKTGVDAVHRILRVEGERGATTGYWERDIAQPASKRRTVAYAVLAGVLLVLGFAGVLIGLFGNQSSGDGAKLLGIGAVAVVFGTSLWSSNLVRPLAAAFEGGVPKLR